MKVKLDNDLSAKGKCELMAEAMEKFKAIHGDKNVIGLIEAWLVNYGREFTFRRRPDWLDRMAPNLCFFNSMALVLSMEGDEHGLSYCEGYVTDSKCPMNIHHAWTATEDGTIVDPTLPEESWQEDTISYFGVRIPDTELLRKFFTKPDRGCLLEYPDGRELVETHHQKEESNG